MTGPTRQRQVEAFASSVLKLARIQRKLTQHELAAAAGVPQSTIAAIEAGRRQPAWPLLCKILAAAGLEPRLQLVAYDDHDDILDATDARRTPAQIETNDRAQRRFTDQLRRSMSALPELHELADARRARSGPDTEGPAVADHAVQGNTLETLTE